MEPRTYQQSTSEIRSVRIQVTGDFTPQDVAQLIYDNNLHEYTFTNGGIGCRYYRCVCFRQQGVCLLMVLPSIVIASFLSSKRWLPEWSVPDLLLRLSFKRSTRREPAAWRIRLGTFDQPRT